MSLLKSIYITPHPPIIIPEVGKGRERDASATVESMKKVAKGVLRDRPHVLIIMSPHGEVFSDYFHVYSRTNFEGDLDEFKRGTEHLDFKYNMDMALHIGKTSSAHDFPGGILSQLTKDRLKVKEGMDHASYVPLYFIRNEYDEAGVELPEVVFVSMSSMPLINHYEMGIIVREAIASFPGDLAFSVIASADLSHKVSDESPYGKHKSGTIHDGIICSSISAGDPLLLFKMDQKLREEAAECGDRSVSFAFGLVDGYEAQFDLFSYEAPFGIGYAVAEIHTSEAKKESTLKPIVDSLLKAREESLSGMGPIAFLAKSCVESFIRDSKMITVHEAMEIAAKAPRFSESEYDLLGREFAAFVSLKMFGNLRGCIGTIWPQYGTLAEEIIHNSISSATKDYRFDKVRADELNDLEYSVDVLHSPTPVDSLDELDVVKYGVIVENDSKRGVLLPDLEGVDTVERQISIALSKAGIDEDENYRIEKFQVERYK